MSGRLRSEPMPVKYWTRAGIMLTDWCNAACACCYAHCSPQGGHWMTPEQAAGVWESLTEASPHGCRVHLTGGEPFGRYELLLEVCRQGKQLGLALESVETNAFWAVDDAEVRGRLRALDEAGMSRIAISADPYHQQFVPIDRPRRLARLAEEVLGSQRVRVRWGDWLAQGRDTGDLSSEMRAELFAAYGIEARDRLIGRAGDCLGGRGREKALKLTSGLVDKGCGDKLLRGRHVHVSPGGEVWPATCVGISIGNAITHGCADAWKRLKSDFSSMPVVGPLCNRGPAGLLEYARSLGVDVGEAGYLSKCYLCYLTRKSLFRAGRREQLGPAEVYGLPAE